MAFLRELNLNTGLAYVQIGATGQAATAFGAALGLARQAKDPRKIMVICENLATIQLDRGDKKGAEKLLQEALAAAEAASLREERKGIRRRLDELNA